MNSDQIYQRAIAQWGLPGQLDQVVEEVSELLVAINKVRRAKGIYQFGIVKPSSETPVSYSLKYCNLCSEVADVEIMLEQLKSVLCSETIAIAKERKLNRLKERLEKDV